MSKSPVSLSIVFSFRNESAVLVELVRRMRLVMTDLKNNHAISTHELIFVNDASTDNSESILKNLDLGQNDIKIITTSRVFGVAPCVMAGLKHSSGDIVVYMDADLQDPPEVIPQMIHAWHLNQNVDVVHTIRKKRFGESVLKMFITKIGYKILNRYSDVPLQQEAGDFKLLTRRMVDHLTQLNEFNPFMRGLIAWVGFNQTSISYTREARFAGESKFFVLSKKVISNFLSSAVINFSSVPLQIASYLGLCAIFIDIAILVHVLIQKFSGQAVPGWSALMIVMIFMGGVQLFCLGTIGLYLQAVHIQTKMRPNYIIQSRYGFGE